MKIETLKLKNFRNHETTDIDFDGRSALITGPNGAGKTNILEAIHLLSTTKSLRAKYDRELINHAADFARIEAQVQLNGSSVLLEMAIAKSPNFENASKKVVKIDRVNKSLTSFAGTLNSVLFAPTDIEILTGPPSLRREYIDSVFFQIDKEYKRSSMQYLKAVRQRNKLFELISEEGRGAEQLPYWNGQVIGLGTYIQKQRTELLEYFQNRIAVYAGKLGDPDDIYKINYLMNEISEQRIEKYADKELFTRKTLVGPHRDDFEINFNGFDIASYGSRGQQRTTVLALKLCEIDYLSEQSGKRPILLLDDIFSELDPLHREAVEGIMELQQTLITTAIEATDTIQIEAI